jgi:cell division protein ZapA (FtsZ GTPase activity inhibitor)
LPVVEIEILGRRYALQSDREPTHIQSVASFVDEQLRQMARGGVSTVNRDDAVLVALNIASELFLVKEKSEDLARSLDRRISSIITLIDHGGVVTTGSVRPPS